MTETSLRALESTGPTPRWDWRQLALNGLLLATWLWLYRPVLAYLGLVYQREDFRTNQLVLVAVLALVASRARHGRWQPRLDQPPRPHVAALSLALGASAAFVAAERAVDVNVLSAALFGLATYGLLGLWLPAPDWRRGWPVAALLILTLPFGEHMQTFIGFPVRLATADVVREGLAALGAPPLGTDTVLQFENSAAQVDLPCSGVRSLWAGLVFLMAVTWVEQRRLGARWLATAAALMALLLTANVARVFVLIAVGHSLGLPLAAEMLHVPLGVLGFVASCSAALWLVRRLPPTGGSPTHRPADVLATHSPVSAGHPTRAQHATPTGHPTPAWLTPALAGAILLLALAYSPRIASGLDHPAPSWVMPAGLRTEATPLTPDETAWLTRDGAESADRRRFTWRGHTGSVILIASTSWRAHHRPERCFEVFGLSLDASEPLLVGDQLHVRAVRLGARQGAPHAASYWFQSASRTTDDYGARIWADLAPRPQRWVLVSLLFDDLADPKAPAAIALYEALYGTVAAGLKGGLP